MRPLLAAMMAANLLQPFQDLDEWVQAQVQSRRTPTLDRVMQGATDLGRKDRFFGMLLAVAILDPAGPATARIAVGAVVVTNLAVEGVKVATNRTRPNGERKRSDSAFPSGHASSAVSVAIVLSRRWRKAAPFFWALAAAVSWSRVYLNAHWITDVVFGAALAVPCTWLVVRLAERWSARAAARQHPAVPAAAGTPPEAAEA